MGRLCSADLVVPVHEVIHEDRDQMFPFAYEEYRRSFMASAAHLNLEGRRATLRFPRVQLEPRRHRSSDVRHLLYTIVHSQGKHGSSLEEAKT